MPNSIHTHNDADPELDLKSTALEAFHTSVIRQQCEKDPTGAPTPTWHLRQTRSTHLWSMASPSPVTVARPSMMAFKATAPIITQTPYHHAEKWLVAGSTPPIGHCLRAARGALITNPTWLRRGRQVSNLDMDCDLHDTLLSSKHDNDFDLESSAFWKSSWKSRHGFELFIHKYHFIVLFVTFYILSFFCFLGAYGPSDHLHMKSCW